MGGKGLVWDVKDSLAADTDAPYRARICHAGREICAPAARGQSGEQRAGSRERRESGGRGADRAADYREKMLRRGMDTDAFRFREETFRNGMPPHGGFAIGRTHHRQLPWHRNSECEGMLDVP